MNLKQKAGERAVDFVEDGMVVGMGSGSTVYYAIRIKRETWLSNGKSPM